MTHINQDDGTVGLDFGESLNVCVEVTVKARVWLTELSDEEDITDEMVNDALQDLYPGIEDADDWEVIDSEVVTD